MRTFRLTSRQRRRFRAQLGTVRDPRVARRLFALLALDRGMGLVQVAKALGVTRQTVYNWIVRLDSGGGLGALADRPGRGGHTRWTTPVRQFLQWSLEQPPDALGYSAVSWTVPLLREHLSTWMGFCISDSTLRRELHRLGYVWKRPRYVLHPDPDRGKKNAGFSGISGDSRQAPRSLPKTKPT